MLRFRSFTLCAALLMLVAGAGCKSNNEEAATPAQQSPMVESSQAPAQSAPGKVAITGKVVETIDASTYTYVKVDTGSGEQWVAIPATKLEVGEAVSFASGMEMKNLESKTLDRTFDSVIFSSGVTSDMEVGAETASAESFDDAMMAEAQNAGAGSDVSGDMASSGGSQAAMVPSEDVKVDKAEGDNAYAVGEIFAKRAELDNQKVLVQGKVVKVSMMIMGKNWVHLQDGTGDATNNTHDLVVTTMAEPEKDSVVTVEGIVHADRDFGAGYIYDVIIEDAEIK